MTETWTALFGIAATVVGGLWTAFVYIQKKSERRREKTLDNSINAPGGIASGRDTVVHGDVSLTELPKGALALGFLGLIILAWAIANVGDRVTTRNLTSNTFNEASLSVSFAERALLTKSLAAFAGVGDGVVADVDIGALQGEWQSRWRRTGGEWFDGTAAAVMTGNEIQFLYRDKTGTYDLRAKMVDAGVLSGHYQNLSVQSDNSDWVGFVTPENGIRGYYERGEWDFWKP
jgi:hypothetical protein